MAKTLQNGSLRMAVLIGGFLVTIATIVFAAGGVWPAIDKNKENIDLHYESGCKPSVGVREDVASIKADVESMKLMRQDISDIKTILMNPVR